MEPPFPFLSSLTTPNKSCEKPETQKHISEYIWHVPWPFSRLCLPKRAIFLSADDLSELTPGSYLFLSQSVLPTLGWELMLSVCVCV